MKLTKQLTFVFSFLILFISSKAQQYTIYAISPYKQTASASEDMLAKYSFNSSSNIISIDNSYVSPQITSNTTAFYGIEQNPANKKLYVLKGERYGAASRILYEFDLNSGITNEIGIIATSTSNNVSQITFDNSGNLYALFNWAGNLELKRIDYSNPTPGATLPYTDIPISILQGAPLGMTYDFDNDRLLIGKGYDLYAVDKNTGSTNLLYSDRSGYANQAIQYVGNDKLIGSDVWGNRIFLMDYSDLTNVNYTEIANPNGASFSGIKDFTLFSAPITPSIVLSTPIATLTSNCSGIPSTPTTFGVTGSNLSSTVIVSAPSGFEISTVSNPSYASSLSLPPDGSHTVSETLYIRLSSSATNNVSGTITASSTSGGTTTSATTTVSSTLVAPPTLNSSSYTLCAESSYPISLTIDPNSSLVSNGWSTSSTTISVNSSNYVTAGTATGGYTVSYTDACTQTVSATVNIATTSDLPAIIDGQASYKINNTNPMPQGPSADLYMGYNGYNYSSITTPPTNTGYYRANNINTATAKAGCPYPFYIFRCTTCPD